MPVGHVFSPWLISQQNAVQPSVQRPSLQPPGTLSAKLTPAQESAALKFAQCVREHGVPDFPDPVNGQPLIDTNHIPSANKPGGMTILNAATHTCGHFLAEQTGGQ